MRDRLHCRLQATVLRYCRCAWNGWLSLAHVRATVVGPPLKHRLYSCQEIAQVSSLQLDGWLQCRGAVGLLWHLN